MRRGSHELLGSETVAAAHEAVELGFERMRSQERASERTSRRIETQGIRKAVASNPLAESVFFGRHPRFPEQIVRKATGGQSYVHRQFNGLLW